MATSNTMEVVSDLPAADENGVNWMQLSVTLGKQSPPEVGKMTPKVGVVIVRDGVQLGGSYRGQFHAGDHAEYGLIERLGRDDIRGATVFTTLEPCSRRSPEKQPCATRLVDAGVATVYIGMYDPNPHIYREGWRMLRDAGISLLDYPDILRQEIERDNTAFVESYRLSVGERGSARFDYTQNAGRYRLQHDDLIIDTTWVGCGSDSIYAIDYTAHVALLRYATQFSEVDNPGSFDWSNYTVRVGINEIVAFRTAAAYGLIRVTQVFAGPSWGADHTALHFDYELRRMR